MSVHLWLVGLPALAHELRRDALVIADNGPAVELGSWVAPATMTKGCGWLGRAPLFFSENPAATRRALAGHSDRLDTGTCLISYVGYLKY